MVIIVMNIQQIQSKLEEQEKIKKAKKQMLSLFITSSSILFGFLIFVWLILNTPTLFLPKIYKWNTFIILISSIILHESIKSIKKDQRIKTIMLFVVSLCLGITFLSIQWIGWEAFQSSNVNKTNIIYPFAFAHFIHVVIALLLLIVIFINILRYNIHSKAIYFAKIGERFWHFLGLIWLVFVLIS